MKQPPGTPAQQLVTVGDLRDFLRNYDDDELLSVMLHSGIWNSPVGQYQGYYPMGGTEQDGCPVLFVNKMLSRKQKKALQENSRQVQLTIADVSSLATLVEAIRAQPENAPVFIGDSAVFARRRGSISLHQDLLDYRQRIEAVDVEKRAEHASEFVRNLRKSK